MLVIHFFFPDFIFTFYQPAWLPENVPGTQRTMYDSVRAQLEKLYNEGIYTFGDFVARNWLTRLWHPVVLLKVCFSIIISIFCNVSLAQTSFPAFT